MTQRLDDSILRKLIFSDCKPVPTPHVSLHMVPYMHAVLPCLCAYVISTGVTVYIAMSKHPKLVFKSGAMSMGRFAMRLLPLFDLGEKGRPFFIFPYLLTLGFSSTMASIHHYYPRKQVGDTQKHGKSEMRSSCRKSLDLH